MKLIEPKIDWEHIDDWMYLETSGVVQSGPFRGMKMGRKGSWETGRLSPMLLGCHEAELHDAIEAEVSRLWALDNPKIANVGCAEGYYAIGLARRLPLASVWVVDTDDNALKAAADTAALNGVGVIAGAELNDVFAAPDLVVMDCEGAETAYLDGTRFPGLLQATIIVEMHGEHESIISRWKDTHHITAYFEAPRNPTGFTILRGCSSILRWLFVCEGRPCNMVWFVMKPKEGAA